MKQKEKKRRIEVEDQDLSEKEKADINRLKADHTIVLQFGSLNIRYGFGTDSKPGIIPNILAERFKFKSKKKLRENKKDNYINNENVIKIRDDLKSSGRVLLGDDGLANDGSFSGKISSSRSDSINTEPFPNTEPPIDNFTRITPLTKVLVGEEAVWCGDSNFEKRYPIVRGRFNTINRSLVACIGDQRMILEWLLKFRLGVPISELGDYAVTLVVSDSFAQRDVAALVNMLLVDMNFNRVFIHQENLCAILGAGIPYACVVKMGSQRISISCVEEAISIQKSRILLPYGGRDISRFLGNLLKSSFKSWPLEDGRDNPLDDFVMARIAETNCSGELLLEDSSAFTNIEFQHRVPGIATNYIVEYPKIINLIALSGLFYPEMLNIQENGKILTEEENRYHPHDDRIRTPLYLRETSNSAYENKEKIVKYTKKSKKQRKKTDSWRTRWRELAVEPEMFPEAPNYLKNINLPLDKAIYKSITTLGRVDSRKRLFSTILLTGGFSSTPGLLDWLEERVFQLIPEDGEIEKVEIIPVPPKEMSNLSWLGASHIANNSTELEEMWVTRDEWINYGTRILREKLPFSWTSDSFRSMFTPGSEKL